MTDYMRIHGYWKSFNEEHPNVLSRDLYIANTMYYSLPDGSWDGHEAEYNAICSTVDDLVCDSDYSAEAIADAFGELIDSGATTIQDAASDAKALEKAIGDRL